MLQKSHVMLLNKNIKLKEKYYISKKTHLATEKNFVLHNSLKINKWWDPNKLRGGGSDKSRKINKRPPVPPFIRHLIVSNY